MKSSKHAKFTSLFGAMLIAMLSATASAEPKTGDRELQLSGDLFHAQGADSGVATVDASFGKYFSDQWLLGVQQGVNYSFIDDADDQWSASTVLFANYNFPMTTGNWQPFIGGFLGALYNDNDTTGTMGPHIGAKYYTGDNTFLMIRYRYEWAFDSLGLESVAEGVDENTSDGNHVVTVGFGINF